MSVLKRHLKLSTAIQPQPNDERAPPERSAFSIAEFCFRNGISLSTYHKLKNKGLGPDEMRSGHLVRISAEKELEWQRARSEPQDKAEIAARAAAEAATKARGKKAGRLSLQSPTHISKLRKRAPAAA
jgi:hypothetical protein